VTEERGEQEEGRDEGWESRRRRGRRGGRAGGGVREQEEEEVIDERKRNRWHNYDFLTTELPKINFLHCAGSSSVVH